jgi:peptidoglycan hydrolase-like protein with peptidoglycan-binding domain
VIALAAAVYSSPAYCSSPSPSPTETDSTSAPADSEQPTDSEEPAGSEEPAVSTTPYLLKQNDTGSEVIRIQMRLRDLGYFNYRATGKYFDKTIGAVRDFQNYNGLDADGCVGDMTYQKLFTNSDLQRKPISPSAIPDSGPALNGNPQSYGELGDWATINTEFTSTAKVTDFNKPDISFNVTRTGGTNLALVEASTSADYAKFLECFGGDTSWEKRSVLVTIGGKTYAASLFGNPSGEDTDTINGNEMKGYTTLYFFGSTTDVLGFIDKEDLKMVMRAAGKSVDDTSRLIYDYCPGKYE